MFSNVYQCTAVIAVEAVGALIDGDSRNCFTKLVQRDVGVAMDTAFVMSGGGTTLVTTPLKIGSTKAGTQVLVRVATEYTAEKSSEKVAFDNFAEAIKMVNIVRSVLCQYLKLFTPILF